MPIDAAATQEDCLFPACLRRAAGDAGTGTAA
jgi:hypothetical protein